MVDELLLTIIELREKGMGYKLIAKELGVTRDQVRGYCRREGLTGTKGHITPRGKRYCAICGEETKSRYYKYCGVECRQEMRRRRRLESRPIRICELPGCDEPIKSTNKKIKHCCQEHGREHTSILKHPWKYKRRICPQCEQEYTPKRETQTYCSHKCCGKAMQGNNPFKAKTHEEFVDELSMKFEGTIVALTEHKGMREIMRFKCGMCVHEWEQKPLALMRGIGCPQCNKLQSVGAKSIEEWLINSSIMFKKEHRFSDCRDKSTMPFDFALFDNNKCIGAIEFNGKQHYEAVPRFGGEIAFKHVQKRDRIKANYCRTKGIPLIVIDYHEQEYISEILSNSIRRYITVKARTFKKTSEQACPPVGNLW